MLVPSIVLVSLAVLLVVVLFLLWLRSVRC